MKYLSVFSGIHQVFSNVKYVGYSEIDKYPDMIYQKNYSNHLNFGDITKINFSEIENFDILVGGSPCQSHSVAGNKKGFDDPRGLLFFDYINLLKIKKPKFFIFENVKGLYTAKKGENLKIVLDSIKEAGYAPEYKVLKSSDYGNPQDRERLFVIGIRNDIYKSGFRYKLPEKQISKIDFSDILLKKGFNFKTFWAMNQKDNLYKSFNGKERIDMGFHQDSDRKNARTVVANISRGFPCDLIIDRNLCKYGFEDCEFCGTDEGWCETCEEGSFDNYVQTTYGCAGCRKWTMVELEILFGFPEGYTDVQNLSISRKKKAIGNTVDPNVIREIMKGFGDLFDK